MASDRSVAARLRDVSAAAVALVLAGGSLLSACGNADTATAASSGFEAEVSGDVTGRVSGPGIVRYLPPSEVDSRTVPGYFFVADDAGVRELGITFMIPAGTSPGAYRLESAHPMDAGTAFEVRVDRSVGNRTESFETNTTGTIRLDSFPADGDDIVGHTIRGSFDFTTRDRDGREVTARGSFDFRGGEPADRRRR